MEKEPTYGILDLFAGPGGLAEGFAAVRSETGDARFRVDLSVEKDVHAHATLRLRAFLRQFGASFPEEYYDFLADQIDLDQLAETFPQEWRRSGHEASHRELGTKTTKRFLSRRIRRMKSIYGDRTVLIGGPPCQAYSLVGRARNKGKADYVPESDDRHFLYREFLWALDELAPAAFIMENVKGMLSSSVNGSLIARTIVRDLAVAADGYRLFPLTVQPGDEILPSDFLIRCEDHGVPQSRHRVIIVGIRQGLAEKCETTELRRKLALPRAEPVNSRALLTGMPRLRSSVSMRGNAGAAPDWHDIRGRAAAKLEKLFRKSDPKLAGLFGDIASKKPTDHGFLLQTDGAKPSSVSTKCPDELADWIVDSRMSKLKNTDTRSHMRSDLERYLFAAGFAKIKGRSPKSQDFPEILAPNHQNWSSGDFADRFRVQLHSEPSSTITSHISKDGHFYIHPDPIQCRSLTVREAARLQTFPDNYVFLGPRTQQYHQVGNAVPPWLAFQIGSAMASALDTVFANASVRRNSEMEPLGLSATV